MKSRVLKISSVVAALIALLSAMPFSSSAATQLLINSKASISTGDDFTFDLKLADCEEPIIGLQMYILYNGTCLSLIEDSLEFENLSGSVVYNTNLDNMIAITWADLGGADFSSVASLVKCKFKVTGSGSTKITYFINHMYGDDMTYIKNYTFTNDIIPDSSTAVYDDPAIVTTDDDFLSTKKSKNSFKNYDDSMGENSPDAGTHQEILSKYVETTAIVESEDEDTDTSGMTIVVIVAIAVVTIAAVVVIFLKHRDDVKKAAEDENLPNSGQNAQK